MTKMLQIGSRLVGQDEAPYVIAEAGVHHYNDMGLAKKLISEAAAAGADAVKFQTYTASRLVTTWAPLYWESSEGSQYEVFETRSLLTADDYRELFAYAGEVGITLLSTPFDDDAATMLAEMGMPAFKIASADLTDIPLLRRVASFGRPVLLSTGASTFDEIEAGMRAVEAEGAPVGILHCSLSYPTAIADANLGRITMLRARFADTLVGYSDHTVPADSMLPCPLAVGLGARVVEKHFTLDRTLPGDDHYHAVDPVGLATLVADCRAAFEMTRTAQEMTEAELAARSYARRSIVAARDIEAGTVLTADDIDFKRPGTGLSPALAETVIGRRVRRDLSRDDLVALEDLD